jgi:hypothetical protein
MTNVVSFTNVSGLSGGATNPIAFTQYFSTAPTVPLSGGGAAAYVWNAGDTRTADGITIIGTGTGRWNAILDTISARDAGALGDGTTDDSTAFENGMQASASTTTGIPFTVGTGEYAINTNIASSTTFGTASGGAGVNGAVRIDPQATFPGTYGPPNLTNLTGLGNHGSGLDFVQKTFDSTWTTTNVFVFCRSGISDGTTGNLVVVQATANSNTSGADVWAGEFSIIANAASANLTSIQVGGRNNAGTSAILNGIVASCGGTYASNNVLIIQGENSSLNWTNGIVFNNVLGNQPAVSGDLIQSLNGTCTNGINLSGTFTKGITISGTFSSAQLQLPSLVVGPTITSQVNYLQIAGATSGNAPVLSAQGSNLNIGITLEPKGNGYVDLGNNVSFGTFTSDATATIAGYITIEDSGGTSRHLAVVNP